MRLVQFSGGTDIHPGVLVGYDYIIDLKVPAKASLGKLVSPIDNIIMLLRQGEATMNAVRTIDLNTFVRNVNGSCVGRLVFNFMHNLFWRPAQSQFFSTKRSECFIVGFTSCVARCAL